jgi:L-threonylcarbamoyladenylate synthase
VVSAHKDLSGKDRIVEATLPGAFVVAGDSLDPRRLGVLQRALEAGAVIGVPTDTVYGIAARWDSAAGVRALFAAKGRPSGQTVAVVFASVEDVKERAPDLETAEAKVLEALLPGPYTFVVGTGVSQVPSVGTADSLGVRVPDHATLLHLITALGAPLAVTSANKTGGRDPARLEDVDPVLLAHCSAALTGATEGLAAGVASTVVDLRPLSGGDAPVILREGAIPGAQVLDRIAALSR